MNQKPLVAIVFLLCLVTSRVCGQIDWQPQPSLSPVVPLQDTLYYPFTNGVQLIEIDHLTFYEKGIERYRSMSQPPAIYWNWPFGNEYILRDSSGNLLKIYNTIHTRDSLEGKLRPVPYVNTSQHTSDLKDEAKGNRVNGYYFIFNYPIQVVQKMDTAVTNHLKIGIMDSVGTMVWPIEYKHIKAVNKCFLLYQDNKWGLAGPDGSPLVPIIYDAHRIQDNLVYFLQKRQDQLVYHTLTHQQNELADLTLSSFNPKTGLWSIKKEGKWGMIDVLTNEILIPCKYDRMVTFYRYSDFRRLVYGYVRVVNDGKYGIVTLKGKTILPCKYDEIYGEADSREGYFRVKLNGVEQEIQHDMVPLKR